MDDIYVDDSFQRVAICSESTLGSPPYHCEFQPATSWNDTSITITLNRGSFGSTDSAYLYVFNSSNTASSGYAITFGSGGGGDTTAPTVSITTSDPSSITSDSLSVTGTASDAVGVTSCKYRLGSAPDASNGTACTGTTSWTCATSGYSRGANTLYVGCADAAGNWGSDSITVSYNVLAAVTGLKIVGGN